MHCSVPLVVLAICAHSSCSIGKTKRRKQLSMNLLCELKSAATRKQPVREWNRRVSVRFGSTISRFRGDTFDGNLCLAVQIGGQTDGQKEGRRTRRAGRGTRVTSLGSTWWLSGVQGGGDFTSTRWSISAHGEIKMKYIYCPYYDD